MKIKRLTFAFIAVVIMGFMAGLYVANRGPSVIPTVEAKAEEDKSMVSPVEPRERDFYAPNSERLASDEMRVIACGTGMPTTRAAQAAACFLVELGNGDKFIFDIGSGSAERLSSLQIPSTRSSLDICTRIISVRWVRCSSAAHSWEGRNHFVSGVRTVAPPSSEQRMPFRR